MRAKVALGVLLAAAGTACWSCNIVGPAAYLIAGPDKTPRQFRLDDQRRTVVFIDDRSSVLPSRSIRDLIGKSAEETLLKEKALVSVVETQAATTVALRERFGQPVSIEEIASAVGAEVVISVSVDSFVLSQDGQSASPMATMRVKVIDTVNRARMWPLDIERGFAVTTRPVVRQGTLPTNLTQVAQAQRDLATLCGRDVARLFLEYRPDESNAKVED